jgi:2-dehydro-3-deoxy-D-gluconate 5-dehydrogenase
MTNLNQYFNLAGRTAVITGGASGFGLAIASALAHAGANVVIADREADKAVAAAKQITSENGRAIAVTVDVAEEVQVNNLLADAVATFGQADILVCAAGIALRKSAFETTVNEFDRLMAVNVRGVFLCNQIFGRHMVARGKGSIINISSQGAISALENRPVYCASKAAVSQLTKTLALDWIKSGVRVNAIAPGLAATPFTEELRQDRERISRYLHRIPAGRLGEAKDMAGISIYLASDAAAYVVGQTFVVDGGWTIY